MVPPLRLLVGATLATDQSLVYMVTELPIAFAAYTFPLASTATPIGRLSPVFPPTIVASGAVLLVQPAFQRASLLFW